MIASTNGTQNFQRSPKNSQFQCPNGPMSAMLRPISTRPMMTNSMTFSRGARTGAAGARSTREPRRRYADGIRASRRSAPRNRMKSNALAPIVIACMASAPAWANPELAQKKNCMACHAVATKVIGPSYKDVAAKYAGQADAVAKLSQKVMKGGSGVWGAVPMPANPQVNEAEAKQLVQWILSTK